MSQRNAPSSLAGPTVTEATAAPPSRRLPRLPRLPWLPRLDRAALLFLALLGGALFLHLYHLGHLYIAPWDEDFHAVVAEHLALHPLEPTLYETAALHPPVAGSDIWQAYPHIWLHIPPLGLWASALSLRLLGVSTLALRLPNVLEIAAGMLATYLLGRKLYGAPVGLIGAAFVGYSPYVMLLSQGYVFGDITDTPLLALAPLAVLALAHGWRTGRLRWLVLAGVLQGLGYLTKSALGLAPTGVALLLCAADYVFAPEAGWVTLRLRGLLPFLAAAVVTALPYNLYIAQAYPATYAIENGMWREAFFSNYENWGRPTDYHVTVYLFALYGGALALLLAGSAVALAAAGLLRRSRADLLLIAWVLTLYLPLSIAVTKAVPMTIAAVPAVGLIVGRVVVLALGARRVLWRVLGLGALSGAALTALLIVLLPLAHVDFNPLNKLPEQFYLLPLRYRLLPYALDAGLTLLSALVLALLLARKSSDWRALLAALYAPVAGDAAAARRWRAATLAVVVVSLAVLGAYWIRYDWLVVARPPDDPGPAQALGALLQRDTPANATILLDTSADHSANERIKVMFWSGRDVYDLATVRPDTVCPLVQTAQSSGSPVFVATTASYDATPLGSAAGWILYSPRCPVPSP